MTEIKEIKSDIHYFIAVKIRLETLYELTKAPKVREQISDEVDWVDEKLAALGVREQAATTHIKTG